MKKILYCFMLTFFAFSVYAEQQVTTDMLVGKWTCEVNKYSQKEYDYQGKVTSEKNGQHVDAGFLIYKKNGSKIAEYALDDYYNGEDFESIQDAIVLDENEINQFEKKWTNDDGNQVLIKAKRRYISDNEFQYVVENIIMRAKSIIPVWENKVEMTCSRIK